MWFDTRTTIIQGRTGFFPATFVTPKLAAGAEGSSTTSEAQADDQAWNAAPSEVTAQYDDLENVRGHSSGNGAPPPAFDDPFVASSTEA